MASKENQEALDTMCKWIEDEIYLIKEENIESMSILRKSSSYFEIKKALQKAINDLELYKKAVEIVTTNADGERLFAFWNLILNEARKELESEKQ